MIHDGDYYSIVDKDKILSLMDEIEQKIIWMCHQNFIWKYYALKISGPGYWSRTESSSVREPGTNGKHAHIGKAKNDGSSANSQEIPVSMDNVCPEGTEDQSVISQ